MLPTPKVQPSLGVCILLRKFRSLILSADGFTYSPVANQYGDSDFILTVSDSVLSSDLNFTVYVQPVNDPPSIEYDEVAYPYFNTGLIEIFESTESNRTLDIIQLDANDSQDGEPNLPE